MIDALQRGSIDRGGEPDQPGAAHRSGETDERLKWRLWLAVSCLLLMTLAFVTRPGNLIADTKIDMAIDPAHFLMRAAHLWDPAQFGQLQDQAAGYYFPMGAFFLLGKLLAVPGWVIQRLWISAVAGAAFLGTVRLARRLGIGTPWTRLAAGFGYALSPAALSMLGVLSGEYLSTAMLPWILLPLVRAVKENSGGAGRVRAAAQSAVAVAMCGGMNAAAVVAVLIPPGIYLLTAARPAKRWRLLACWAPAVSLACLWWVIPLLLLNRYGVSVLPYTESAATTTSVTSLANTFRGTEDWLTYLTVNGQPWWPVGFRISTGAVDTILTGIVAGVGLSGLLAVRRPEKRFLLVTLLVGLVIIVAGYVSSLGSPLAGQIDHLINGPLEPFRNLRKFDPLIRLPLALGLAGWLSSVRTARVSSRPWTSRLRWLSRTARLLAVGSFAAVALPAFVSGLSTPGDFPAIPPYWVSAASWLNQHAGNQGVLAEPGAAFGQYVWGQPMDDVLEALSTGNWASIQLATIGSVGNERLLQAIDQQISAGNGSAGLTRVLADMGVKYIVVRNDLSRATLGGAWPARVRQALATSPGLAQVAQFGQPVGTNIPGNAAGSFDPPFPPVQIYQVRGAEPVVQLVPAANTIRVYGGPEALLTLADQNLLRNRPVVLDGDAAGVPVSQTALTDSLRKRVRNFGEIRGDYSATMTATEPVSTFEAATDFLEPSWAPYVAVARYHGIANVTASSSDADIGAIPAQSSTGRLPYSAVDGNLATMWESGSLNGPVGQWIKINFLHPMNPHVIHVAFVDDTVIGPQVTRVEVSTAAGQVADRVRIAGLSQALRVPTGLSAWLRIKVTAVFEPPSPDLGRQVAIGEISVPGVTASREIVAPGAHLPAGGDPTAVILTKAEPPSSSCMRSSVRWVCSPSLVQPTEEQYGFDQGFAAAAPEAATLTGTAVLQSQDLVDKYAYHWPGEPHVSGSASSTADPQDMAASAFDGNPATSWVASPADANPTLTIRWGHPRKISQVTVAQPDGAAQFSQVLITGSRGQLRGGWIRAGGLLRFAPLRTDSLSFRFTPTQLPLQISEVAIPGVRPLHENPQLPFRLPCGFGPAIQLDGKPVRTSVIGTFGELLTGQPMAYRACGPVSISAGQNQVVELSSDVFDVQTAVIDQAGRMSLSASPAAVSVPVTTVRWTDTARDIRIAAHQLSYLMVNENYSSGWQATLEGHILRPVRLEGWKQAWLLPAGRNGSVRLTFRPDALYRTALFGGLFLLGLVVLCGLAVGRRRSGRRVDTTPAFAYMPAANSGLVPEAHGTARPPEDLQHIDQQPAVVPPSGARSRRLLRAILFSACICVLLCLAGVWLGGYPGAIILPSATGLFVLACRRARRRRAWLALSGSWPVFLLLVAASISLAVGDRLRDTGDSSSLIGHLISTWPQVACLIIVGRLAAALIEAPRSALEAGQAR